MKKIGFFGGTFDPIHFGHINLALEILEKKDLDEVLFCVARQSPFKKNRPPVASPEQRISMVEKAVQKIPFFKICRLEVDRPGLSYTIDTLRALRSSYDEEIRLFLLLSDDSIEHFHDWKESSEIVQIAIPFIGLRKEERPNIPASPVKKILQRGLIKTRSLDISSTEIRKRLKKGLYCGHLVPETVLNYIQRNGLYN